MRAKNKLIFLGTLFITCLSIWPLYGQMLFDKGSTKDLTKESIPHPKQERNEGQEIIEKAKIIYKAENLRDPFQSYIENRTGPQIIEPMSLKQVPMPALEIQGLFWGGKFPQAIINNRIVREGDTIGEVKIISIKKDGVTVLFSNMEYKLSPPGVANLESSQKSQKGGSK